ncbi:MULTISPECIES: hypothetical protein [Thermocrispum]|uniref:Carboxypeptidase regulatory-like domain-containing protein n=1 Tax=Thermocrispum agreste TaxID=37925 RepID=A0ABD6FFM3_9PSEU|nr:MULTISPECIES: hypothetical protein [Thermocrispum]
MRRTRRLVAASAVLVTALSGTIAGSAWAEPAAETKSDTTVRAVAPAKAQTEQAEVVDLTAAKGDKAGAAKIKTKIIWTHRSTWITYGGKATLEGQVVVDGGALPGVEVVLFARNSTSKPWVQVDKMKTSTKTGLFRFYRKPPRNYYFGVAFAGTGNYEPSAAYAKVGVRRNLSGSKLVRTSSTKFKYYGKVRPGGQGTQIKLQYKQCASCGWKYAKYTRANSNGTWKFVLASPPKGKKYYYRAYSPSSTSYMAGYAEEWWISRW